MNEMFNEMFGDNRVSTPFTDLIRSGDNKEIENYLKKYDVKADSELFFILDKITISKDLNFDVSTVKYSKYIIEMMLVRSPDCYAVIMALSMMGEGLTNQQHYDYLVRNVPVGRKNYTDRVKKYLAEGAKKTMVRILLEKYYDCSYRVTEDYYEVLKSVNGSIDEFLFDQRWYLNTDECQEKAYKLLPDKDSRSEYELLVSKIMEVKL